MARTKMTARRPDTKTSRINEQLVDNNRAVAKIVACIRSFGLVNEIDCKDEDGVDYTKWKDIKARGEPTDRMRALNLSSSRLNLLREEYNRKYAAMQNKPAEKPRKRNVEEFRAECETRARIDLGNIIVAPNGSRPRRAAAIRADPLYCTVTPDLDEPEGEPSQHDDAGDDTSDDSDGEQEEVAEDDDDDAETEPLASSGEGDLGTPHDPAEASDDSTDDQESDEEDSQMECAPEEPPPIKKSKATKRAFDEDVDETRKLQRTESEPAPHAASTKAEPFLSQGLEDGNGEPTTSTPPNANGKTPDERAEKSERGDRKQLQSASSSSAKHSAEANVARISKDSRQPAPQVHKSLKSAQTQTNFLDL